MPKNSILGQKHKIFKNPKKFPGPKQKYFQTLTDIISSEQLRKLEKVKPFGHSKAPKKKVTDIAHFPRPGQIYPYVFYRLFSVLPFKQIENARISYFTLLLCPLDGTRQLTNW